MSIQEPYEGDSVSVKCLFLSLLGGTAFIIYISDALSNWGRHEKNHSCHQSQFKHVVKHFYTGFVYILAVTEVLKVSCTELRPHFIQTCQPDVNHVKCSSGLIVDFNCTGPGPKWLIDRDIYKSFPSGHASLSFYTFVFLSIYVCTRPLQVARMLSVFWKIVVPSTFFLWSAVCCISRLLDHRHFWWDVLAGIAIGLIGGLVTVKFTSNYSKAKPENDKL